MSYDGTEQSNPIEKRPSMTALFKNGAANGLQNKKHKRLFESLQWRQAYINKVCYEYHFDDSTSRSLSLSVPGLRMKQILNGEMKGLGTGTFIWPAAHVLAKYFERQFSSDPSFFAGKSVCDIGCGTGICGLVTSVLGAEPVILTDLSVLSSLIDENILLLKDYLESKINGSVSFCEYDWNNPSSFPLHYGKDEDKNYFDVLIISDCVLPKLYPISLLVNAVDYLLSKKTRAYFSYEHRPFPEYDPRQEFRRLCSLKGLQVNIIPMTEHHPNYCAEDIEIWEVLRIDSLLSPSSDSIHSAASSSSHSFQLLSWGEGQDIPFLLNGHRFTIKQTSSLGVGGALWPSSVVCSL
jgi:predicted nicotinamide N-methyase